MSAAPKGGFTAAERAAMKERAAELKAAAASADGDAEVRAKMATMGEADRMVAERIHELVREAAPALVPRTWYGMPAYTRAGKVVVFFQESGKFAARYGTLGFQDSAQLDDGDFWPTAYAVSRLTPAVEERIVALVRRAAGA